MKFLLLSVEFRCCFETDGNVGCSMANFYYTFHAFFFIISTFLTPTQLKF
jgi:hypothetical protein